MTNMISMLESFRESWLFMAIVIVVVVGMVLLKLKEFTKAFESKKNSPQGVSMDQIKSDYLAALNRLSSKAAAKANMADQEPVNPWLLSRFLEHGKLYRQQYSSTLDQGTAQLLDSLIVQVTRLQQSPDLDEFESKDWESVSLNAQRLVQRMQPEG